MANPSPTTKVVPSFDPFDVKEQLVELAQDYFNLDEIDTYESGFMGYLIQALTYLTSDVLYQNALSYNEAFLNRALLRTSVTHIADQLDYKIQPAVPASGSLTIAVPITLNSKKGTSIKISSGTNISAGNIPYKVYNTYYIKQGSNGLHVTAYNADTGLVEEVPYNIEMHDGDITIVFAIQIWQVNIYTYDLEIDNPILYQFYKTTVTGFEGELYKVIVDIEEERYKEIPSIYQGTYDGREYEMTYSPSNGDEESKLTIKLGNGIYGYQPKSGATGKITIYTTLGKSGNIASGVARFDERLINTLDTSEGEIEVLSTNKFAIQNGRDAETLNEIKRHTVENISAAKRLVTEGDYRGYAGVTGLTNIIAYPMLNRRDVVGNDITIYNALYDDDFKLVPTASIPVRLDSAIGRITKGSKIVGFDGNEYCCPFDILYDESYDVPTTQYVYNLASTKVAPVLFTDTTPDDVEMAVRMAQCRVYPNDTKLVYTVEIVKLDTMKVDNISAIMWIGNNEEPLYLHFTQEYANNTVVNMSTEYIDYSHYPVGPFQWKVKLYYTYPNTTDAIEYATYTGTFNVFESGEVITDEEITENVTATGMDTFLSVKHFSFNLNTDGKRGVISVPVFVLQPEDNLGETVNTSSFYIGCYFKDPDTGEFTRENKLTLHGIGEGRYTFNTKDIPLTDLQEGEIPVQFRIYVKNENGVYDVLYNTYYGTFTVLTEGKRAIDTIFDKTTEFSSEPLIELVHLGLASIDITSPDNGDSYMFICNVTKLPHNASSKITVNLTMTTNSYDMTNTTEYYMNYTGDMVEVEDEDDASKSSMCVFTSPKIKSEIIPTGQVTFKITLKYDGKNIATYKQSTIFKQDITRIIRSDVHKFTDGLLYACNVPVILKDWYDQNIDYLDQEILSRFLNLSVNFNNFGMLTDRINIKFVRTCGKSTNMTLNNYMPNPVKSYPEDFSIDLPVKIHVVLYVSEDVQTDINDIITEAKNVIYTFLQLKSGFNANIYRSELARYLHDTLEDILFCEVKEPTDEIIYSFDIDKIPRSEYEVLYKYCPEYIWFDKDNIEVDVKLM